MDHMSIDGMIEEGKPRARIVGWGSIKDPVPLFILKKEKEKKHNSSSSFVKDEGSLQVNWKSLSS